MKRKREEIEVYIEKVSTKEIEGEYEALDICAQKHSEKELMRKTQAAGKFEINQLMFNGKPTGYARCSSRQCRDSLWIKKKSAVFQINPYKTSGAKWQLLERHLKNYHFTADEIESAASSAKQSSGPQQTKLNLTTKNKKLPKSLVDEMRAHNIAVVAQRHTSLNFFSKEEVRERDRALLKAGGFDPDEVLKFDRTGPTVKKDLERNTETNLVLISKIAPKLAEEGLIALSFDHQELKKMNNQKLVGVNLPDESTAEAVRPKHALGTQLILAGAKRSSYLIGFRAVAQKDNQTTLRWARETLQESAKQVNFHVIVKYFHILQKRVYL